MVQQGAENGAKKASRGRKMVQQGAENGAKPIITA